MVTRLPSDLLIFSSPSCSSPLCIQYLTNGLTPVKLSDCVISFSWCGKIRSCPPPWISRLAPRYFRDMAVHSMCQPGRRAPPGRFHEGSPGGGGFGELVAIGCCFSSP